MSDWKAPLAMALAGVLMAYGCGSSNSRPAGASANSGPDRVVCEFLEAVRTGNDQQAGDLLSPLARQRTSDMEMVAAPPGSDTAKFRVGDVELVEGQARVHSEWTDLDTDGLLHTDEIVWMLRRETIGWRIIGMATKVFVDRDPVLLNFEEPVEMLRQQQLAEEELARRDRDSGKKAPASASEPLGRVR